MSGLAPDALIAVVVVVVVVVICVVICLICCLCRKCDQCARWSRRKANAREEAQHVEQTAERHREFDQVREERNAARDQIRAKYNLPGGHSNPAVIP